MEVSKRHIAFIINPVSGTNNRKDYKVRIANFFENKDVEPIIKYTTKAGDATEFAKEFVKQNVDAIIAVGGDGTVNEVVNGIGLSKVPMGIIPKGSGNGLSRHIGIPMKLNDSLKLIEEGVTQLIDVLDINNHISLNVSGVGFDALVAYRFQNLDRRGLVSYVRIILTEFATFKAQKYEIVADGKELNRDAYLISFANSSQFGNNAFISPKASLSDGYFDLCIVKPFPKISSPLVIERLMSGTLDREKYLEIIKAKEVILKQESKIYHIDGDAVEGEDTLRIKIVPSALNMLIPKEKLNKI